MVAASDCARLSIVLVPSYKWLLMGHFFSSVAVHERGRTEECQTCVLPNWGLHAATAGQGCREVGRSEPAEATYRVVTPTICFALVGRFTASGLGAARRM